ncbi:MAG TPA: OmpH family outer membrane protein [Planctomycetota bacterium]|jgi:Skp family chaperone for outer membrane proteins|nr:OmpH family outer membrane protein [Planctomycetota bacterium]
MRAFVLGSAAALLALAAAQPESAPAGAPARLGFLDIDEALRGSGKVKADLEELQRNLQTKLGELKARAEELNKQKKALAILDPDSREYFEKRRDLDAEFLKLDAEDKYWTRYRAEREETVKLAAYDDIRRAVGEVASAKGLDAVFRIDKTDAADARTLEERGERARRRMVFSSRPELDITPEVIRLLNR